MKEKAYYRWAALSLRQFAPPRSAVSRCLLICVCWMTVYSASRNALYQPAHAPERNAMQFTSINSAIRFSSCVDTKADLFFSG